MTYFIRKATVCLHPFIPICADHVTVGMVINMSKFCGKCGSKRHELFGLCPNCNADEFQHELADEIAGAKREPVSKISTSEKKLEKRQKVEPETEERGTMEQNHTVRFPALKAILILLALGILFVGTIGGIIYRDLVDMPLVKNILWNSISRNTAMQGQYELYSEVNNEAVKLEEKYAIDGFVSKDQLPNFLNELSDLAEGLKEQEILESYSLGETGVFMKFESGIGYYYSPNIKDIMDGDQLYSILTIEPYATSVEFITQYVLGGKSPDKAAKTIADSLPEMYYFDDDHNRDKFSIEDVEQLGSNKVIIWYGHGGYIGEYGPVLGTSVPIKDKATLETYAQELVNGEMVLGKDCFCLCPSYFDAHIADGALDGCIVYLAACESGRDNRLANVFLSKGATLVVGNTRSIFTRYNLYMMYDFMTSLTNMYEDATYWTAEDALQYAKKENGETDGKVMFYGAEVRLIYPDGKSGYRLKPINTSNDNDSVDKTPEDMYQDVLSLFRDGISTGWANYESNGYGIVSNQNEFAYSYMWSLYPVDSLSDAGYAFIDLDGNGVQELLIGRIGEGGWGSDTGMIYDLYTYRDGEAIHLFSSGERDAFFLCSDSLIANEGAGGAALSGYDYYVLDGATSSLRLKERVLYDGWTDENNPWFYGTEDGAWDASHMIHISEEDALGIINDHMHCPYELVPFGSAETGNKGIILPEDPLQPEELNSQLIGVLNYIVGDWTDGSAEYRIFADERFERNVIHITNGEVMFRTNIESGTVVVTGEASANLAPYVQPGALQSWSELKYDSTTDTIYVGNDTHPYYRMSDWVSGNTPDVTYAKPDGNTSEEKKYGDNVTWTISDGVLRASGVGKMENYTSTSYIPWYEERAKVTSVIMEGTITSVGSYAFDGFGKMTSIILPDTIKSIEEFAFWRCDDLPSITIPNGCTVIGNSAFNWCESLEVITLPATITEIQWNAFAHCVNLSDIYFAGTMEQWQSININRTGNEELLSAIVHYNSSGPGN